jgi:hypothetical protein
MALKIEAKRKDGIRRCGMHHPATAVVHPEGKFTAAQVKELKAEPLLHVVEVPAAPAAKAKKGEPPAEDKGNEKDGE